MTNRDVQAAQSDADARRGAAGEAEKEVTRLRRVAEETERKLNEKAERAEALQVVIISYMILKYRASRGSAS